MCKVLQVSAHQDLMMNYLRHFDGSDIVFDFELSGPDNRFRYHDDPKFSGSIHHTASRRLGDVAWLRDVRRLVLQGDYTHVHIHSSWASAEVLVALSGIDVCKIVHGHSNLPDPGFPRTALWSIGRQLISRLSDSRLACTERVGQQMFCQPFTVIPNVIEYQRYRFSEKGRDRVRKELGISATTRVIGHVGHIEESKNHDFVLRTFSEYQRLAPDSVLILVGSPGNAFQDFQRILEDLRLLDSSIFLGDRSDVPELLSAFDIFLFPSRHEGFGMSLLEAQVSGLDCFASAGIPHEVMISNQVRSLDLVSGPKSWAAKIFQASDEQVADRSIREQRFSRLPQTFDAPSRAQELARLYRETARI